jgi:hypothetical protein
MPRSYFNHHAGSRQTLKEFRYRLRTRPELALRQGFPTQSEDAVVAPPLVPEIRSHPQSIQTFPDMPKSAIRGLNVQCIVRLDEMAPLLTKLSISDNSQAPSRSPSTPFPEGG